MAKKSSNNAIAKINKQLTSLERKNKEYEKESVPIIDKRKLKKGLNKRFDVNTNVNKIDLKKKENKNIRDNIIVNEKKYKTRMKNNRPIRDTVIAVDVTKKSNYQPIQEKKVFKKEEGLSQEETIKLKELETEMRTLYDNVNDVIDDINDNINIGANKNISIDKILLSDNNSNTNTKDEEVNFTVLNRIIIVLSIIFGILFISFIVFVIFVTTF